MTSKGLLIGRFTYWEDAALQQGQEAEPLHEREGGSRSAVELEPAELANGGIYLRTHAFLYQPGVRVITRMSVTGPEHDSPEAEDDRPDVYTAMAGVEAERNFVGARAVGDELRVDSDMGWGLLGVMDMLEPEDIQPWLAAGTGDNGRRRIPAEVVEGSLPVGAAMFVSGATTYEAVLDPPTGTVRSWTGFIGSRPALSLTLKVKNFLDVFPSP